MNRLIIFFFLLLPFLSRAQNGPVNIVVLTKDSLTNDNSSEFHLSKNWRFHIGDSLSWADKGFSDGSWEIVKHTARLDTGVSGKNMADNQIEWYRLHFIADSSIVGIPLAITMSFNGAAEVYIDGKKIVHYGKISSKDSTEYISPNKVPRTFVIGTLGEHVLAVRFLNYHPNIILKSSRLLGFAIWMGEANNLIINQYETLLNNMPVFIFLFSIFLALCVIHLLLFLYYRSNVSNLFFSIFCLSLSAMFLLVDLLQVSEDPHTRFVFGIWVWPIIFGLSCFSFSGINNELFGGKKLRFQIIAAICFLSVIVYFINIDIGAVLFTIAGLIVMLEAIMLTIRAIIKKRRGARIVGIGILFFTVFILITVSYTILNKGLLFTSGSIYGAIFAILASCAILSIPFSMSAYLSWNFAAINKDLTKHLQQVQLLSEKTLEQEQEKKRMLESQKEKLEEEGYAAYKKLFESTKK